MYDMIILIEKKLKTMEVIKESIFFIKSCLNPIFLIFALYQFILVFFKNIYSSSSMFRTTNEMENSFAYLLTNKNYISPIFCNMI